MGAASWAVLLVAMWGATAGAQPGVGNRCVMWGSVFLEDGSRSLRFAPEPIPDGPHYLHYIVILNGSEDRILTELAPKWDPHEDVNIPGNGFYGCELGNFADPEIRPGDKVQIIVTDEGARQQGTAEVTVPELPGAINCDVRLHTAKVNVPRLRLEGSRLVWDDVAPVTLVYQRLEADRHTNGKARGQYTLMARLTAGERAWQPPASEGRAWIIVQEDAEGRVLGRSREARTFREPDGFDSLIAVTGSGMICTLDVGAGVVTVRDPRGARVSSFTLREGTEAKDLRAEGETVEVWTSEASDERDVYSLDGQLLRHVTARASTGPPPPWPDDVLLPRAARPLSATHTVIVDGLGRCLVVVSGQQCVGKFKGLAFGGFRRPRDMVAFGGLRSNGSTAGSAYVLDGSRILVVPLSLEEEMPRISDGVVRWRTGAPVESRVTVSGQGREVTFGDGKLRREHEVRLGDLPGPGKYRVSVSHSIRVLGEEPTWASVPLLIPPASKGQHAYLRARLAMVILANVVRQEKAPANAALPGPVSDAEIERLKQEMLIGQRFYWINSHLRFLPAMDFIVDREFHDIDPYGNAPTRENLAPLFAREGKSLADYDGVCRLVVEQTYDANAKTWRIASSGGGLTSGVSKGSKDPGWSWWPAGAAGFFVPDSWLFVHEYGHQVDAMFDASGEPSFWGNHFAPQEGNVARFGEHFDGNAYILRRWPEEKWFTSDWGTVEFTTDADEDGVPDDAPEIPIDEKRFGSDPTRKDTDRDGLSDRDEIMAWNGITAGLGQVWAQPILPNPRNPDTDGDGVRDGRDPNPLYPVPNRIAKRALVRDGRPIPPSEWPPFHRLSAQGIEAQTALAWDDECLYIACHLKRPGSIFVQLDADNDGWFVGKDNISLTIEPPASRGEAPTAHVSVLNAAEPGQWPFNDETLLKPEAVSCVTEATDGYSLVIALPRSPHVGVRLEKGETIGLNVGYAHPTLVGQYAMLFEPHVLVALALEDY